MVRTDVDSGAERDLLGGLVELLVLRDERLVRALARVPADAFAVELHGELFRAIVEASATTERSDWAYRLTHAIRTSGDAAGVAPDADPVKSLLADVAAACVGQSLGLERSLERVSRMAALRRLGVLGSRLLEASAAGAVLSPLELAELEAELARVKMAAGPSSGSRKTLRGCIEGYVGELDGGVVPTGLSWFDNAVGGLPLGGIIGLAAPPGVGKSALALQLTVSAMLHDPSLRAVWGLGEMSSSMLARRCVVVATRLLGHPPVSMRDAKRHESSAVQAASLVADRLGDRLEVVMPKLTVAGIERAILETGAKVCCVDYLQLVQGVGDDRLERLDSVVADLKTLVINHRVSVLAVLNMAKSQTSGKAAIGSISKGSSETDYAVDFLWRGEPPEPPAPGAEPPATQLVRWVAEKARDDQRVSFELSFDGAHQYFEMPGSVSYDDVFGSFSSR